jgi:signal transduction histidine kinase
VIIIDASRLDDQMLEVIDALKEVAPDGLLLAAVTPAARLRVARMLDLGSDAVVGLPADAAEIEALLRKLRRPRSAEGARAAGVDDKLGWLADFAGGVAHNINNPLTTVVGYLQILRSNGESKEQTDGILSVMLKECDRISDIVKNLLPFSGGGGEPPHPVDVNQAVDASLVSASVQEENGGVNVERSYEPALPAVLADEEGLRLACENVVLNARRAMPDGGTLSVETSDDGAGHVLIRFSDTGRGIPEDKLDKVFAPFYTGNTGASTGLGLAASYGIVKGLGGSIDVSSSNGEGTTFVIKLPAAS